MANPDPSPNTRFGAENGNQSGKGKTSEQRRFEVEAAEMSAKLRHMALSEMMEKAIQGSNALDYMDANGLKLIKDSEDRAHGTPKATSEVSGPNGGAIPISEVKYTIYDPVAKDAN